MNEKQQRLLLMILFAGGMGVFYAFDPANVTFFPACQFKTLTGWDCPGCGGQRALHDLLHLRLFAAADHNLLLTAGSPLLAIVLFRNVFSSQKLYFSKRTNLLLIVTTCLFWIARNLPFSAVSWLAAN